MLWSLAKPLGRSASRTERARSHRRWRSTKIKRRSTHQTGGECSSFTRSLAPLILICCRVGAYARVFGVPREFMGTVVFVIYAIRPVEDPHEVFFHLMEAIVVTLQYSRGRPPVCTLSSLSAISSVSIFVCHSQDFTTQRLRRQWALHSLCLLQTQT